MEEKEAKTELNNKSSDLTDKENHSASTTVDESKRSSKCEDSSVQDESKKVAKDTLTSSTKSKISQSLSRKKYKSWRTMCLIWFLIDN